jgi:hypothetical protein
MKAYLALTAIAFAALTVVHVWRAIVEPSVRSPWFLGLTLLSAVLCGWAVRLWLRPDGRPSRAE